MISFRLFDLDGMDLSNLPLFCLRGILESAIAEMKYEFDGDDRAELIDDWATGGWRGPNYFRKYMDAAQHSLHRVETVVRFQQFMDTFAACERKELAAALALKHVA